MGKLLTSPVAKFPGTVTLCDPLTFPQYKAWQAAVSAAKGTETDNALVLFGSMLPGVCACVEAWNLTGQPSPVTPDTFIASPQGAAVKLLSWLIGEISQVVKGDEEIPNA